MPLTHVQATRRADDRTPTRDLKTAVLVAAFGVGALLIHFPDYFVRPQFWAEDGIIWRDAYLHGASSLFYPLAGYSNLVARAVALIVSYFPIEMAPALYFAASASITLAAALIFVSPRIDLPYSWLVAISILCASQGSAVLGTAANLQWIMPFFLFAILISRRPSRLSFQAAETAMLFVAGMSGPFSVLIAPLFMWRAVRSRSRWDGLNALVVTLCGAMQGALILANPGTALPVRTQWSISTIAGQLNEFWRLMLAPVGSPLFTGRAGAVLSAVLAFAVIAGFAYFWRATKRYRFEYVCACCFAAAIVAAGVFKVGVQDRYLYGPQVMAVVALCALACELPNLTRVGTIALTTLWLVASLASQANSGHFDRDYRWSEYTSDIRAGRPVTIPIAPNGWTIELRGGKEAAEITGPR